MLEKQRVLRLLTDLGIISGGVYTPPGIDGWSSVSDHLVPDADDTQDVGAAAGNQPRTVYAATSVVVGDETLRVDELNFGGNGNGSITVDVGDLYLQSDQSGVKIYANGASVWDFEADGDLASVGAVGLVTSEITLSGTTRTTWPGFTVGLSPEAATVTSGTPTFGAHSTSSVSEYSLDSTSHESIRWDFYLPQSYDSTSNLSVEIRWNANATTGDAVFGGSFATVTGDDLDSALTYATEVVGSATTTSGTAGVTVTTTITFSNAQADSVAAGALVSFVLQRRPSDGGDTLAVDAKVVGVRCYQ